MKTSLKYSLIAIAALLVVSLVVCGGLSLPAQAAGSYYVDCSAGSNGDGSSGSPWNNLGSVNATTFAAGDAIYLKRGTTCVGQLYPKGSGASGSPITIGAYGSGARPIVDGNQAVDPVVLLHDQEYWEISDLEIKNSEPNAGKGIYVSGSSGADLTYFRLSNLYVHHSGIHDGGNNVGTGMYQNHSVHDVVIDNIVAHNGFRGVESGGKCCNDVPVRSTDVTVRNVVTYDVENDGILVASANNVLVEYNVAYNTGIQPSEENHTPNAIWNWDTDNAVYQFNEAYENHSPGKDGGAFDIDYFSHHTTYQYNYGHDNDAYCLAIFGGDRNDYTTDNTIRYNICSNNARDGSYKLNENCDLDITVWSGGNVQDSYIYNNTFYWNPANAGHSAILVHNIWHGKKVLNTNIYNNILYAAGPKLVDIDAYTADTTLDYNLYWYTGAGSPEWKWGGTTYTAFGAWQSGSGQDANGLYADPKLNDPTYHAVGMPTTSFTLQSDSPAINAGADLVTLGLVRDLGSRDFFGNSIPNGAYDIGAHEYGGAPPEPTDTPIPPTDTPIPPTNTPGGPTETPVPPTDTPPPPTDTPLPTDTPEPTSTPSGGGGTIFFDGFEDGEMSDWNPTNNAGVRTERVYEGVYSAGAKLSATFQRTISTAGYTGVHVKYAGLTWDMDEGSDYLLVEWFDGSSWNVLEQLFSDAVWTYRDWDMPAGADDNADFALRFTGVGNKNTEWAYADNIEVTSE